MSDFALSINNTLHTFNDNHRKPLKLYDSMDELFLDQTSDRVKYANFVAVQGLQIAVQ